MVKFKVLLPFPVYHFHKPVVSCLALIFSKFNAFAYHINNSWFYSHFGFLVFIVLLIFMLSVLFLVALISLSLVLT